MNRQSLLLICILFFSSCKVQQEYERSISHHRISEQDEGALIYYFFKGDVLDGNFEIRGKNGYITCGSFKNGLENGVVDLYMDEKLISTSEYENGLLNGISTTYLNPKIRLYNQEYKKGFPNGLLIGFSDNGIDTSYQVNYRSNPYYMEVFFYDDHLMNTQLQEEDIVFSVMPCLLKADKYSQRFYSALDSSLINEVIWERMDSCTCYRERESSDPMWED